jgi:hypothetical protein
MPNRNLTINSEKIDIIAVTIASSPVDIRCGAAGTTNIDGAFLFALGEKFCTSCAVRIYSGTNVYMAFERAASAAPTSWVLSSTYMPVPVNDLAKMHFIGGSGSEVIQVMYRS